MRTGVQWRPWRNGSGSWKTVYERLRLWSGDGTWELLLRQVQAAADVAGEIDMGHGTCPEWWTPLTPAPAGAG
ncbi:transposase [Streptomyces agglomeratus]|uniref:transposase n=1 Tax=Streptomyces agglomeratus TaxID=285458 RepID=UPI000D1A5B91